MNDRLTNRSFYENYVVSQFPIELGRFTDILDEYSRGNRLTQWAMAVVPAAGRESFTRYTLKLGATQFIRPEPRLYCWHYLYWDKKRQSPVWRFGLSRM